MRWNDVAASRCKAKRGTPDCGMTGRGMTGRGMTGCGMTELDDPVDKKPWILPMVPEFNDSVDDVAYNAVLHEWVFCAVL
jgi:hypothetical protein